MSLPTVTGPRALKLRASSTSSELLGDVKLAYGDLIVEARGFHATTTRSIRASIDLAKLLDELAGSHDTRLMMLAALTNQEARHGS